MGTAAVGTEGNVYTTVVPTGGAVPAFDTANIGSWTDTGVSITGPQGAQGIGVSGASIDATGHLVLSFTDPAGTVVTDVTTAAVVQGEDIHLQLGDGINGAKGHVYWARTVHGVAAPAFTGATPANWNDLGDLTGPEGDITHLALGDGTNGTTLGHLYAKRTDFNVAPGAVDSAAGWVDQGSLIGPTGTSVTSAAISAAAGTEGELIFTLTAADGTTSTTNAGLVAQDIHVQVGDGTWGVRGDLYYALAPQGTTPAATAPGSPGSPWLQAGTQNLVGPASTVITGTGDPTAGLGVPAGNPGTLYIQLHDATHQNHGDLWVSDGAAWTSLGANIKGPMGPAITIMGHASPTTSTPATPAAGDAYVVEDGASVPGVPASGPVFGMATTPNVGDIVFWDGTAWANGGQVQGPQGPRGVTGPQPVFGQPTAVAVAAGGAPTAAITGTGATGTPYLLTLGIPTGLTGDSLSTRWTDAAAGTAAVAGGTFLQVGTTPAGGSTTWNTAVDLKGDEGTRGSLLFTGADDPATTPPTAPAGGFLADDLYLQDTGDLYRYDGTTAAWVDAAIDLKGPQGSVIHSGAGDPVTTGAAGVVGDYYLDTTAHALYGPKTGDDWAGLTAMPLNGAGVEAVWTGTDRWGSPRLPRTARSR